MFVDARVERTEEREHFFPHAYAEVTPIRIGGIAGVAQPTAFGVGLDLRTVRVNQGTKKVLGRGREHGKPLEGSSTKNADQNSLGAVLQVMPGRDKGGIQPRGDLAERSVPRVASASLEVAAPTHG